VGIGTLAGNALRRGYLAEMVRKVGRRLESDTSDAAVAWAESVCIPVGDLCTELDRRLWSEACTWAEGFRRRGDSLLASVPYEMGGGGDFAFMYFLTRMMRPRVVVETGVAAGWTTAAVLTALRENGEGDLFSSDFPYFRHRDPEQHIGVLVPSEVRDRWVLDLRGDRKALPDFVTRVSGIDLVHYDSDKSYAGRQEAAEVLRPHLSPTAVWVEDDLHNNVYFRDTVTRLQCDYRVLSSPGHGYIGVIGLDARPT